MDAIRTLESRLEHLINEIEYGATELATNQDHIERYERYNNGINEKLKLYKYEVNDITDAIEILKGDE